MKVVLTSSRSCSIVAPTDCRGRSAATTGCIMRLTLSFGYAALRCHWRASSALAEASARSRASAGSASRISMAKPGLSRESARLISAPPKCSSLAAAPPAARLFTSSARSGISSSAAWFAAAILVSLPYGAKFRTDHGTISVMTPRAITIRLAEPRDSQAIALMSRDFIEAGLGWKYDASRVMRAIRDRETLAVVACDAKSGAAAARGAVNGFAIMEFGEERAHLVLLAVRPSHRRAGIGQRMLEWMLESARCAGIASIHLELRAGNEAARRFYRAMGFYETVLVPGYYRSGEGRKECALRMLRVLRVPGPLPAAWRPPRMEDR